jgi:hypothetical protein
MEPRISSIISGTKKLTLLFILAETVACTVASFSSAQTVSPPPIKVESNEVVLPIKVFDEKKSTGVVVGSNGEAQLGGVLHTKEVTGLSAKSVHIFDDGVEVKIQHFSVEKGEGWEVRDNIGDHEDYSCTPRGIWVGPDVTNKAFTLHDSSLDTYLATYVPRPSPAGSCHRVSIKVDHKHSTVFAPLQYCNTNDPLSDPLQQTDLGDKLAAYADSKGNGDLPLALEVVPFLGPSDTARINLSADLPANQLRRHWDGIHLITSIAVLGFVFDRKGTLVTRFSDTACGPSDKGYSGFLPPLASVLEVWEQAAIPGGYETQVNLSPGDYRFEFLLTDGEKIGRASASLTVDDFSATALSLSGIALCKRYHKPARDERGPTHAPQFVPLAVKGIEFTPTADTKFKKGEKLMAYVEIYSLQRGFTPPPGFFLEMNVMDTKTGELRIGTGPRTVVPSSKSNNAIPVVSTLEIEKLPPGSYRLEAQASDSIGNKTKWRAASFTVE